MPSLILLAFGILYGATTPGALTHQWPLIFIEYLPAALSILLFGQLWEEGGWRGFALPRMQPKLGPLTASLILGLLQGLWHMPAFFFAGGLTAPGEHVVITIPIFASSLLTTILGAMIFGVIATWLYNGTQGSLLMVILFHTLLNAGNRLAFMHISNPILRTRVSSPVLLVFIVLVLLILVFTKGRLSYKSNDSS